MVPGHEIAGIVTEVGSDVTKFKVGDRVGVGCFVDSCRECEYCLRRRGAVLQQPRDGRHLQRHRHATASRPRADTAARSSSTRTTCCASPTRSRWTAAAPLLCAGITTYSPLRHWGAGAGTKVAVIGLGGLGHMAVKLARRNGRRSHRAQPVAQEDGGRSAARRQRVLRDQRPRHLQEARGHIRPDPEHRLGQPRHGRLPRPARTSTAPWSNSACPRTRWRSRQPR